MEILENNESKEQPKQNFKHFLSTNLKIPQHNKYKTLFKHETKNKNAKTM